MKTPTTTLPRNQSPTNKHDPIKRLSLAVRELDKLINRANHLASLSEQPFPKVASTQAYPLSHKHHTNSRTSDS